jgi:putative ABC transport system permease protein
LNEALKAGAPGQQDKISTFYFRVDRQDDVSRVAATVDNMFHDAPEPTKTETESNFRLSWIAMMGNVKAFILSICLAVVFAILLVSANTMAMSIRERVREVAVLKTLGFTRTTILSLFVGEAVTLALAGGVLGALLGTGAVRMVANSPAALFFGGLSVTPGTFAVALAVAAFVGFISSFLPSLRASRLNIVEGLRYVG